MTIVVTPLNLVSVFIILPLGLYSFWRCSRLLRRAERREAKWLKLREEYLETGICHVCQRPPTVQAPAPPAPAVTTGLRVVPPPSYAAYDVDDELIARANAAALSADPLPALALFDASPSASGYDDSTPAFEAGGGLSGGGGSDDRS